MNRSFQLVLDIDWQRVQYPCAVEPKIDGFRCMVMVDDCGGVHPYSRNGREWTWLADALQELSQFPGCWFDGELVIGGTWGATNAAFNAGRCDRAAVEYHVFAGDVDKVQGLSQVKRVCRSVAHDRAEVAAAYDRAIDAGREGVVVKTLDAAYIPGRSHAWMRIKPRHLQSVDVPVDGRYIEVFPDGSTRVRTDK